MKTLIKGDRIKRHTDSTRSDWEKINRLLKSGWKFCNKKTWRLNRTEGWAFYGKEHDK